MRSILEDAHCDGCGKSCCLAAPGCRLGADTARDLLAQAERAAKAKAGRLQDPSAEVFEAGVSDAAAFGAAVPGVAASDAAAFDATAPGSTGSSLAPLPGQMSLFD